MEDDPTRLKSEATVETDEVTELLAFERRFDLLKQLSEYAAAVRSGQIKSGLLPHQVPAFEDTVKFFEKHAQELNTTEQLTLSGYLDLPTSFGKSVMMAKIAEAFGIGKTPEGRTRKRKALILVPTQQAVEQTIGQLDQDGNGGGFAKHAPDISTGAYYQFDRDLEADAVIMTYQSFLRFIRRIVSGETTDPDFDIIMCDEAQHTLGSEITIALNAYREGKIAIGLTATPEFDEDRTIAHLFPELIHKSELLPLIEGDVLNGVQIIGMATGSILTTSGRGGEFSERELSPLISDDERNLAIVTMAMGLVGERRRGVINALSGGRAKHATLLATALNGQKIVADNGELITIRAEAISSFIEPKERRRILREYKEGKIHILTQVKTLNENWDESEVGFIINATPTASKVVAYQRIGRGMRPSGDWPITIIVEFIDDIVGRKHLVTAWNVFGEDEYEQGKIYTTPERREHAEREQKTRQKKDMGGTALFDQDITPPDNSTATEQTGESPVDWAPEQPVNITRPQPDDAPQPMPSGPPADVPERRLTFNFDTLDETLRGRIEDFTIRVARELTIKRQEIIGPPKPGWIELVSLAEIAKKKGMGIYALRSTIINEGGFGCELAETSAGIRYYVERGARQFIIDYEPLPWAPSTHKNIADIERELGVARQLLESLIEELKNLPNTKVKGKPMRSPTVKRKLIYYNPAEYAVIKARVDKVKAEMPQEGEDIVFLSDLAKETKMVRGPIQFFLVRHHGIKGEERRSSATNQKGMAYTKAEADIARFHFSHQEIPKRAKLLEYLEQATGLPEDVIRARVEERNLDDIIKKGRFADARGDYHYTLFCTDEDFERAILLLTQADQPPAADAPPIDVTPPPDPIGYSASREELLAKLAATKKPAPPVNTAPPAAKPTSSRPAPATPATEQQPTPPAHPVTPPPTPPSRRAAPRRQETLMPSSTAVSYLGLLRDLRCNPAAARFLLRQMPFAGGAVREDASGRTFIEAYAVPMLRSRCAQIGAPPKSCRSDRYFAERFNRPLSDVHRAVKDLMPGTNQIGLFRTDDGSNVITLHYVAQLAEQVENLMRKRFGLPR